MHQEILCLPKATQSDHPRAWVYDLLQSHAAWRAASDFPNLVGLDANWFREDQDFANFAAFQYHLEDYATNCNTGDPRALDF